jgi:hypothetical protein
VYDRHANLLHVARTLAKAEAWAFKYWDVASVGDREVVDANDCFHLLLAKPEESGSTAATTRRASCDKTE